MPRAGSLPGCRKHRAMEGRKEVLLPIWMSLLVVLNSCCCEDSERIQGLMHWTCKKKKKFCSLDKHNHSLDPRLNKQEAFVEVNLDFSTFSPVIGYS